MEDTLKQILSELKYLKEGQKSLEKQVKENFDHLTKEIFNNSVKLEEKINANHQDLNAKLDRIYINTVSIAKQFTNTTDQELPVLKHRQIEHSNQLEDHEERISKLEAVE